MKKKIIITLIALLSISVLAFSLNQLNENSPPIPTWGYDITWDDSNCDCGTVTTATLAWAVYHKVNGVWGPNPIDHGTANVLNLTEYSVTSDEALEECLGCYKICAKVTYWDSNGQCCTGDNCEIVNSYSLLYNDEVIHVDMN